MRLVRGSMQRQKSSTLKQRKATSRPFRVSWMHSGIRFEARNVRWQHHFEMARRFQASQGKGMELIAKSASRTKMLFCLDDESHVTGNVNFGGVYYQHNLVHQACNC